MTTYTRLTVVGPDRRADLVVPDTEPIAAMLPDILTLLDHAPAAVALVTHTGERLDTTRSLADQDVADGTPLWITPIDRTPFPAQVADVTDLTADRHSTRPDAWNRTWALATSVPVVTVLAFLASHRLDALPVASVLAGLVVAACVLGRLGWAAPAVLLAAGATGVAITTALALPLGPDDLAPTVLACLGIGSAVVALVGGLGFGDRALATGGGAVTVLVAVLVALTEAGAAVPNAAATVAVLGLLVLGTAPGIAMTASGLSGLDDRLVTGRDTPRDEARRTVDAAYRSMTWLVVGCTTVVAGCAIAASGSAPWGRWLTVAVVVALVLRMRVLPLVPQRVALVLGALGTTVALLTGPAAPEGAAVYALVVGSVVVAAVVVRPAPVVVARLNRLGDLVESLAVLALVPLLLAQWGVFADLAEAFG